MCALVGTRAVPYIGWTEQLRRREHFAGAPSVQHSRTPSTPTAGHASICAHGQGTAAQGAVPFLRPYLRQNFHTWKDREEAVMRYGSGFSSCDAYTLH